MKRFIDYIRVQDKIKLILYLISMLLYVLINNLIFNIVLYVDTHEYIFNDLRGFGYPCDLVEEAKTLLFYSVSLKLMLFCLMIFIQKKQNFKYLTEILIIYFLFDFGQIGSMLSCDIINNITGKIKFDGFWYFSSNFEIIYIQFNISMYIICGIWSLALGVFLWKTKRFSIDYFAKRFFIMPLSGLIYGIAKYYFLYHFVWHK